MRNLLTVIVFCLVLSVGSSASGDLINVALQANGGTATAISEGTYAGITMWASYAIDGEPGNKFAWCSYWSMPAWVKVEFNQPYLINRVAAEIDYHQQTFAISLSPDGSNWTQVVAPRLSAIVPESYPTGNPAGNSYEAFDIDPMMAKFMKVDITTTSAPPTHIFQAIVGEVEAYSAVPIPPTMFLLGSGLIGLVGIRRKLEGKKLRS
jgi:hypothetical protein